MARIVEGDAGKVICREAERLKPAAVVMGTRGRSLIKRYHSLSRKFSLLASVSAEPSIFNMEHEYKCEKHKK